MPERLKQLRESRGLSKGEAAKIAGIHPRTYSGYENGTRKIKAKALVRLAKYYETSVDYLADLTDDPRPYPTAN